MIDIFFADNKYAQTTKIPNALKSMLKGANDGITELAKSSIATHAMIPTTIGFKNESTIDTIFIPLYLKKKYESSITIINGGVKKPSVANIEPSKPAVFVPTKVAALIAIGPGVI